MAQKLDEWSKNGKISEVHILRGEERYLKGMASSQIRGKVIKEVYRRGKYLSFELDDGSRVVGHNAMTGFWDCTQERWTFDYVEGKRTSDDSDVRVMLELQMPDGSFNSLMYHDARLFGRMEWYPQNYKELPFLGVGPDSFQTPRLLPGTPIITRQHLEKVLRKKKPLKELLLKQSLLAGIGNIYAAELLFACGISPMRDGSDLQDKEFELLLTAIFGVFAVALAQDLDYKWLQIYRKKNCPLCAKSVKKYSIKGRSTYWCEGCQK